LLINFLTVNFIVSFIPWGIRLHAFVNKELYNCKVFFSPQLLNNHTVNHQNIQEQKRKVGRIFSLIFTLQGASKKTCKRHCNGFLNGRNFFEELRLF